MTQDYTLAYGTHATPEQGRCAREWVSHLAGEPHSDEPACVSPALRALCIMLNDGLADVPRQRLRPCLARTIGTAGDGLPAALAVGAEIVDDRELRRSLVGFKDARQAMRRARGRVFGGVAEWAIALLERMLATEPLAVPRPTAGRHVSVSVA